MDFCSPKASTQRSGAADRHPSTFPSQISPPPPTSAPAQVPCSSLSRLTSVAPPSPKTLAHPSSRCPRRRPPLQRDARAVPFLDPTLIALRATNDFTSTVPLTPTPSPERSSPSPARPHPHPRLCACPLSPSLVPTPTPPLAAIPVPALASVLAPATPPASVPVLPPPELEVP